MKYNFLDLRKLKNTQTIVLHRFNIYIGLHRVANVTIHNKRHEVIIDICNYGIGNDGVCGRMASSVTANVCFNNSGQAFILGSKADAKLRCVHIILV